MERRQALKLSLVIASLATAFMPWITISFFGFSASMSLAELVTHLGEAGSLLPWIISGIVYLIGAAFLMVRDEAPYIQLIGLLILPAAALTDTGSLGAFRTLALLWEMTGYGMYLAQATTIVGILVFARPRRLLALIERYLPVRSWLDTTRTLFVRVEGAGKAPVRRQSVRRTTIRPAVREPVRSIPQHDGMPARPFVVTTTTDAWWIDAIDASPRAAPKIPCIRLPPPRTRGVSLLVRQDGGRRDR